MKNKKIVTALSCALLVSSLNVQASGQDWRAKAAQGMAKVGSAITSAESSTSVNAAIVLVTGAAAAVGAYQCTAAGCRKVSQFSEEIAQMRAAAREYQGLKAENAQLKTDLLTEVHKRRVLKNQVAAIRPSADFSSFVAQAANTYASQAAFEQHAQDTKHGFEGLTRQVAAHEAALGQLPAAYAPMAVVARVDEQERTQAVLEKRVGEHAKLLNEHGIDFATKALLKGLISKDVADATYASLNDYKSMGQFLRTHGKKLDEHGTALQQRGDENQAQAESLQQVNQTVAELNTRLNGFPAASDMQGLAVLASKERKGVLVTQDVLDAFATKAELAQVSLLVSQKASTSPRSRSASLSPAPDGSVIRASSSPSSPVAAASSASDPVTREHKHHKKEKKKNKKVVSPAPAADETAEEPAE